MNEKEHKWKQRIAGVLKEELQQPEIWLYLSFADDVGFRGGVVIKAHGLTDAVIKCNWLQINPHGEIQGIELPESHIPPERYRNRLLTKEEIKEMWPDAKSIKEMEEENTP